jgi:copper chaperone CopZ
MTYNSKLLTKQKINTMKKIIIAILALAFSGSVMASNDQTATFFVNYHCGTCIKKIEKEMPHVRGVKNFKTDLKGLKIEITYNPKRTDPEKLQKAIEKLGFVVKNSYEEILKFPAKH